jgi:hypothetical protein
MILYELFIKTENQEIYWKTNDVSSRRKRIEHTEK